MSNRLGIDGRALRIAPRFKGGGGGGGSSGGTQTVVNKTELPGWLQGHAENALNQSINVSQAMLGPYQGPRYASLTDGAVANIAALQQNVGATNPAYAYAQNAAAGLTNYVPQNVSASAIGAPSTVTASRIGNTPTVTADQVQAGMLAGTDLSSYMNPYTQNVIASGLSALDAQRMQALNQVGDQFAKAGAFGGSRQGVAEGVTNSGAAAQAGALAANLMAQNFSQAQNAATADINRNLQAQGMNQSANLNAANATAGYNMQGSLANQQAQMAAALANQNASMQTNMFNAQNSLQAQLANQAAGLQGAGLNLAAANAVGNLASQGQNAFLQGTMAAMGGQQQYQQDLQNQINAEMQAYQEAQQFPLQQLQVPLMAIGAVPYGTTTTSTGPAPQQNQGNPWLQGVGALGSLAGGIGSLISASDERLKTDIKELGPDPATGVPMYAYRYKDDPKSYPKVVGPMAQDVEKMAPGAVREIGGRKVISNLGFPGAGLPPVNPLEDAPNRATGYVHPTARTPGAYDRVIYDMVKSGEFAAGGPNILTRGVPDEWLLAQIRERSRRR